MARLTPNPSAPNGYDSYTFTVRDGLPFEESNQWSSLVDRAGRLWVGTSTAVAWLDPAAPEPPLRPSPLLVERVTADDREIPWTGAPLRLGEGPGEVTFEYALLSYFREPDIRYRVQLVGWQSSPSDWLPEPLQRYSHLAPGAYRFRVWGRDAAGVVSGPLEIPFLIPQSPWRTGWASLLYGVAATLLIGGGVRWRIGVLKQRTRRLEELVRERTESLAETVRDLEQSEQAAHAAKEEADRANRFKSDFLANMSHEIRTPMNAVIGMTSILAGTRLTAEQHDYVGTIRSSGESLLGLLNDILDFSKIEAGMLAIEEAPFALRQCVEEAVDLLAAEAQRKGLLIGSHVDSAVPAVIESDATRLRQILVNLLANAVKFTAAGKVLLTVTAAALQDDSVELCFEVLDTGIGISAEHMDRLFRPFSQADSSTARLFGGTGLGLAISQRLVERLGGRIWAESRPGEGSRFRFTIRCRIADAVPPPAPQRDHEPAADLSPLRILVAEDNAVNQKVLLLMLQRLGYAADVVADGEEALGALRRQCYDVVLMDVQMPRMDGIEATRRIRTEQPAAEQPRIIAVTANALREDHETCLAAGMDDYLSKPVLLENLRAALSGRPGARHDEDTAKDFDPQRIDQLRQLQAMTGQDLVSPIIDRFLADAPRRWDDLRAALDAQDGPQLSFAAHAFKGSSGQIGASRVAALCQELESQGRDAQWDGTAEIVAQLGTEIERVAPLLLEFLHAKQGEDR
ncbi:MAG TPA: ATP-binding protein [Thermoanaerobaculia bacterium]|nr:ATP-binding protein [Thermoanaerobaculia bacterium]